MIFKIEKFVQFNVYSGLVAGLPNERINQLIIDDVKENYLSHLGIVRNKNLQNHLLNPYFIEPKIKKEKIQLKNYNKELIEKDVEYLPNYVSIIEYSSGEKAVILILFVENVCDQSEINKVLEDNKIIIKDISYEIIF